VIAFPIWTAPPESSSLWLVSSAELNVAPWIPSRPVRPPDQGVAQVSRVEVDRPVDRRDAHPVAVVAHPGDHAFHDAAGMEHAGRQVLVRRVGRGKAEHVGVADRSGAHARAHRVADHAPDAGVGPAVRLQGRGVVVRLDLEHDVVLVVEPDHPGVVLEHAHAPIPLARLVADMFGGRENRLAEHVLEMPLARRVAIVNPPGKRLVATVLAPGLRDRLQLDIGRVAIQRAEMGLDRLHLDQRQVKLPFTAEPLQRRVVRLSDRHRHQFEAIGRADLQVLELQRSDDHLLDGVVGQHLRAKQRELLVRQGPLVRQGANPVFLERPDRFGRDVEIGDRRKRALRYRVGHSRLG
jgi:hypothetical protein